MVLFILLIVLSIIGILLFLQFRVFYKTYITDQKDGFLSRFVYDETLPFYTLHNDSIKFDDQKAEGCFDNFLDQTETYNLIDQVVSNPIKYYG